MKSLASTVVAKSVGQKVSALREIARKQLGENRDLYASLQTQYSNLFIAGDLNDPRGGFAQCVTCKLDPDSSPCWHEGPAHLPNWSLLEYLPVTSSWVDGHKHSHRFHVCAKFPVENPKLTIIVKRSRRKHAS
jgi:hypothetical protein